MYKKNKGFTLIELLVVIAIIGILSSVVLASLNSARKKARDSRRVSDIKTLQLALVLYGDDNSGSYPAALADLKTGGYMTSIPIDPGNLAQSGGGAYYYAVSGSLYHIAADLENLADVPTNDAQCSSIAPLKCFTSALTGGFDGEVSARYDQIQ